MALTAQESLEFPSYVEAIGGYLKATVLKAEISERLRHQKENDLPGDKDTVALCLNHWDEYYSYSDDQVVWRRGNADEKWLIKHDKWFDRCVSVAQTHLRKEGVLVNFGEYDDDTFARLRLKAYQCKVTDSQWSRIVVPVQVALLTIDDYQVARPHHTLPTGEFEGTRHHKVLAVPRYIRDTAERVRIGLNEAVNEKIPFRVWTLIDSTENDTPYLVSSRRFVIYPYAPSGERT